MGIWHSIIIQISIVVIYGLTLDMNTLSPLLYQTLWHKYDAHVASMCLGSVVFDPSYSIFGAESFRLQYARCLGLSSQD